MSERRFVRIHNKIIRLDSIAYVDFLDSGRSMIFMRGLTQEKQNIAVDPDEAAHLPSHPRRRTRTRSVSRPGGR